ncbi:hypothetical protein ACFPC0_17930 [Streptomyces andamanensis]|uniref:Uncharacterized protein n=1 Tax=Streptomyces andamanensis TaxID=1565035 RepID=A0ABV8TGG7_9ACTN
MALFKSRRSGISRKDLNSELAHIEARLASKHEGIAFHVVITATVNSDPPDGMDAAQAIADIRDVLRHAAADALRVRDAFDLATVQDVCAAELGRERSLAAVPRLLFTAKAYVGLLADDRAAVSALLEAQRKQTIADELRRQRTEALAVHLSQPATLLAHWLEEKDSDWTKVPTVTVTEELAQRLAEHRPVEHLGAEYALVDVVRQFLSTFPEPSQKMMIHSILAGGMRALGRHDHADRVEALAGSLEPAPAGGP